MNSGNIYSRSVENHVYSIDNVFLNNIGINSFSIKGFEQFKSTQFFRDLPSQFSKTATDPASFLGYSSGEYFVYNKTNGYTRQSISASQLKSVLEAHENSQTNSDFDHILSSATILDIQNSMNSCVYFPDANNPVVTVYVYDIGARRNDRVLSTKGAPIISDNPRRSTGGMYSFVHTMDNRVKADENNASDNPNQPGTYIDIQNTNTSDVKTMVTAPLKIHYNETLNCFESSNTILARLISPLPPAELKRYKISMSDTQADGILDKDYYKPTGDYYMGQFRTGLALPLSVKSGNPNTFGPNIIQFEDPDDDTKTRKKLEVIRVVNRSDVSFQDGTIVLCTMIDGEWIVQKFAGEMEIVEVPPSVGRWGFYMHIASSDVYFRDGRGGKRLTPAQVQASLKNKFYETYLNIGDAVASIAQQNRTSPNPVTITLNRYLQTTSMDLAPTNLAGFVSGNGHLHRCNMEYNKDGDGDNGYAPFAEVGVWWGVNFPDGYVGVDPGLQIPADIGTLGYYASATYPDSFPLEDTISVINIINTSSFAQDINKVVIARCNNIISSVGGEAYYSSNTVGSMTPLYGNTTAAPTSSDFWVGVGQYPRPVQGTTTTAPTTTNTTTTNTTTTNTTTTNTTTTNTTTTNTTTTNTTTTNTTTTTTTTAPTTSTTTSTTVPPTTATTSSPLNVIPTLASVAEPSERVTDTPTAATTATTLAPNVTFTKPPDTPVS